MSPVLIASLVLNVVLAALLFFKSALNDLFREYVLSRLHERKRRRALLKRLSAYLETLPFVYFNWLTFGTLAQHAPTEEERAQAGQFRDENHALMEEARQFIRENRFDFSLRVQDCLGKLQEAMALSSVEIITTQGATRSGIVQATQRIYDAIPALRDAVQAEIGKPSVR